MTDEPNTSEEEVVKSDDAPGTVEEPAASDDLEVDDIDDDEFEEDEELAFWSDRQKELVTAQADYNLGTLRDLAADNTIDMKPHFQRRYRWDSKKKSKLIESLLLNVPIPPIYLNEDRYGKYSIIDGKQRISAVYDFMNGIFPLVGLRIFSELNGKKFGELPGAIQTILKTRPTLRAIIVLRQSDSAIKYEVFQRLNTGGVPLNPQEIRNNVYSGALNNRINQLGESPLFHAALAIDRKESSRIYQEMRDSELVLRFMTFCDNWETFSGGVRTQMDQFMEDNKNLRREKVETLTSRFSVALSNVVAVFGEHSFQRWQPEKEAWRNQVLASLYDAEMLALQDADAEALAANRDALLRGFKALFTEPEFLRSVNAATNTPSFLKLRVRRLRKLLADVLI
jgi:Protein of unknown function DUF262